MLNDDQKKIRELKRYLSLLVRVVEEYVEVMDDAVMVGSSTELRGRQIAALTNKLELAKDEAKHFGLGKPLGRKQRRK